MRVEPNTEPPLPTLEEVERFLAQPKNRELVKRLECSYGLAEPSDVELLRRAEGVIAAQVARLTTLEAVLLANEWNGSETDHRCPECHESRAAGHTKKCAYGAALFRSGAQMCATGAGC